MARGPYPDRHRQPARPPVRYEVSDGGCAGLRSWCFRPAARASWCAFGLAACSASSPWGRAWAETGRPSPPTPPTEHAAVPWRRRANSPPRRCVRPGRARTRARPSSACASRSGRPKATPWRPSPRNIAARRSAAAHVGQRRSDLELICASVLGRLPVAEISRGQYTRFSTTSPTTTVPCAPTAACPRSDLVDLARRPLRFRVAAGSRRSPHLRGGTGALASFVRRRVARGMDGGRAGRDPFGPFVRFVLLTATRRGEAAGLRRTELSDGGGTWTIPAGRYKMQARTSSRSVAAAQRIVAAQPALGDYVFSTTGQRAFTSFADRKKEFDEACGVRDYVLAIRRPCC